MVLLVAGGYGKFMRSLEAAALASLRRHYPNRFQGFFLTRPHDV
jgi:hypothetical protein